MNIHEQTFAEFIAQTTQQLGGLLRDDEFRRILEKVEAQRQRELAEKLPRHHVSLTRINDYWTTNPIHQREYSHTEFLEALKELIHDR